MNKKLKVPKYLWILPEDTDEVTYTRLKEILSGDIVEANMITNLGIKCFEFKEGEFVEIIQTTRKVRSKRLEAIIKKLKGVLKKR